MKKFRVYRGRSRNEFGVFWNTTDVEAETFEEKGECCGRLCFYDEEGNVVAWFKEWDHVNEVEYTGKEEKRMGEIEERLDELEELDEKVDDLKNTIEAIVEYKGVVT